MRLAELAAQVAGGVVESGGDYDVSRIEHDSRRAGAGSLFVAVRGLQADGHDHAAAAAARGAAIALERPVPLPPGTPVLRVPDTRWDLGRLAAALHGWPARRLRVVGVTGSAGKTTTAHLTAHVLEAGGLPCGLLSSMEHRLPGAVRDNPSGRTTMESPAVQERLAEMAAAGARAAVIETSSHALDQGRVAACEFDVAAFTNVGHDHLDYHGSFDAYLRTKARLIELCAAAADKGVPKAAVLNRDDPSWAPLADHPIARRLGYGTSAEADVRALDVVEDGDGAIRFRLAAGEASALVRLGLRGRFNVANALCAAAVGLALGLTVERAAGGLSSFPGLRGRMEVLDAGQPFRLYIDFAHTAVCLAASLTDLRARAPHRLLAVFGMSGGSDHDPAGMGRAASRLADYFVITTDDPAPRDPADIAREIESGVVGGRRGRDYEVMLDRRAAIRHVLAAARPGDVVLLAGKGHERTLLLPDGPVPWDERAEAVTALRELGLPGA